jgi:D-glycero-beta-D-manno-heptose-7-phosphate kinase
MNNARPADLSRLIDLVESFSQQTILLLGDFVADEFVFGEIARVSREAPVLILRHRDTNTCPGGGANAANNLADLGARVRPVAAVGEDDAGEKLIQYFAAKHVDTTGLVRVPRWTTPAKARFLAGWPHTAQQQVLRMDREPADPLPAKAAEALARKARERMASASALLVSDYGYGSATPELLRKVRGRGRWPVPVALDSRYRLHDFKGLSITAATPNEAEIEAAHGACNGSGAEQLAKLAKRTMTHLGLDALVVTRGRDGMTIFQRGYEPQVLPVFGSNQAVDVTGAGDTVIAVFALALAAGATVLEAAQLSNYAGGIVVMKRATATVTRAELLRAISAEVTGTPADAAK